MTADATTTAFEEASEFGNGTGLGICPLLDDLNPEQIETIERACRWLRKPAGRILFRHQDPPDAVYFVVSGMVKAFLPMADGKEVNYAQFGPGEMFGELAAIDGRERALSSFKSGAKRESRPTASIARETSAGRSVQLSGPGLLLSV